ncbi:hypothetical protein HK101_006284, partial [Irineochytrium annulatum]
MEVETKVRKLYAGLTMPDQERLGLYMLDDAGRLRVDWALLTLAVTREIGRQATIKEAAATRGKARAVVEPVVVPVVLTTMWSTAPLLAPLLPPAASSAFSGATPLSAASRRFPTPTDANLEDVMHRL